MFELAPVSLWLEDFSGVRALFDAWRAEGVTDLRAHFAEDPTRVAQCAHSIRVIKVNQKTLAQFEAADFAALTSNLASVFRDDMLKTHLEELCQLWAGKAQFTSQTVNYTLGGRRLDVLLKGAVLPGHEANWDRVLVSVADITELEGARHRVTLAEQYVRGLFEHSPVSLWVEDFSAVKRLLDGARGRHRRFSRVHRRASGVRRALHAGDPRARRESAHARHVRREGQEDAARAPARRVSR
jgi:PAS domain-containing protein